MSDDRRRARFEEVAANRLGHVRCALETVHHRHNASAVLRTCDAFGIQRVHLVGESRFAPSQGTAKGSNRWLDLTSHADPADAIRSLKAEGVSIWIADFSPTALTPAQLPLDKPVCVWFGAEVLGVCEEARAAADGVVMLPMRGFAQSLNVSVAAALILREVSERARSELGADALLTTSEARAVVGTWLARDRLEVVDDTAQIRAVSALGHAIPDSRDPTPGALP